MHFSRAATSILGLALIVGACSSSGATTAPTTSATEAPSVAPAASQPATGLTIALASTSLGSILVDGTGRTLYVFTPDTGGTPTCYDTCASNWPPLTSDAAPTVGDGLAAADFGSTKRTDGSTQITFHGHPLYYFAGDTQAGDTNGEGLNGKWFVVDATGQMVEQPSPTTNLGY
jgi:predicted lipoprotein with Yx(FWY)xxD motif